MGQLIISIRLKQDLQFEISLGYTGDCFKTKMKKSQTSKNKTEVTPKHKIPNWTHLLTFTKNFIAPQPVKNTLKTQQYRKKTRLLFCGDKVPCSSGWFGFYYGVEEDPPVSASQVCRFQVSAQENTNSVLSFKANNSLIVYSISEYMSYTIIKLQRQNKFLSCWLRVTHAI